MFSIRNNLVDVSFGLYGFLILILGLVVYFFGVLLGFIRLFFDPLGHSLALIDAIIWYSGIPTVMGLILIFFDFFVLLPLKKSEFIVEIWPVENINLTVVLTAYNDECSIYDSVKDFLSQDLVKRVIVVDNNSNDNTAKVAELAGAMVFIENQRGYGACVWRGLYEGMQFEDTDLVLLCEGDQTFRSYDIDKFLAYLPHADIVNGTRIVEQLRSSNTQLSTFMFYGNFFVGKLLEIKHLGRGTFTDVGTTYKLCRKSVLKDLLPMLNKNINLEFNAHFLDTALSKNYNLVECPITFHPRVGISKGGNVNNLRALKVGLKMIVGILFNWKYL